MNAPDPITPVFEQLAPDRLIPSRSAVQALRRSRFDTAALQELADSIASAGIIEPIIVRPGFANDARYEIVAGERRWLAAGLAKLDTVPVLIRELSDTQVLKMQLVENLQREGLQPLEEAEGYRELMRLEPLNAESVGQMIGKSRAYVYARIKLLDLCPAGQLALQEGKIDSSKALLLSRFATPKLQQSALDFMQQRSHLGYRDLVNALRDKFLQRLDQAPFDVAFTFPFRSITLTKKDWACHPFDSACTDCNYNSANDGELQAAIDAANAQVRYGNPISAKTPMCTNEGCYTLKVRAHGARLLQKAEAKGLAILTDEADIVAVVPRPYGQALNNGFLALDAESEAEFPEKSPVITGDRTDYDKAYMEWEQRQDAWHTPTYRELLKDVPGWAEKVVLAQHPKTGVVHELLPEPVAKKALKAVGQKLPQVFTRHDAPQPSMSDAEKEAQRLEREKETKRRAIENVYRILLFKAIGEKWGKSQLKTPELACLAEIFVDHQCYGDIGELIASLHNGAQPVPANMKDAELHRLLALVVCSEDLDRNDGKPSHMLPIATRLRIDVKKLRAQATKDIAAAATPATTA